MQLYERYIGRFESGRFIPVGLTALNFATAISNQERQMQVADAFIRALENRVRADLTPQETEGKSLGEVNDVITEKLETMANDLYESLTG